MEDAYGFGLLLPGASVGGGVHRAHAFGGRDRRLMALLASHLPRAAGARLAMQTAFAGHPSAPAVLVFDRDGRAEMINPAAQRLMGEAGGAALVRLDEVAALAARLLDSAAESSLAEAPATIRWRGMIVEFCLDGGERGHPRGSAAARRILLVFGRGGAVPPKQSLPIPPPAAGSAGEALLRAVAGCGLTPTETAVARLMARGMAEKEIAHALHRTRDTVKFHVAAVYRKCGVRGRAAWMAWLGERDKP